MAIPQNVYDDPDFFAGYRKLRQTGTGLNECIEQPALWSMLPKSLQGLRILDLGCGFGEFARKARGAGARCVVGVDVSERMLAQASELTSDTAIEYRRQSIEELDLDSETFDLVVSSLAFHYVCDYEAAVLRIAKLVVRGGSFVFSVEHPICTAMAQQQWIRDRNDKPLYWPVDHYGSEGERQTRWFVENVLKYHRTVESYVNGLIDAGFILERLSEPQPIAGGATASIPDLELHRRRPPFLVVAARR